MTTFTVGYFVGSLAKGSINRKLARALVRLAPRELQLRRSHRGAAALQLRLRRRLSRPSRGRSRTRSRPSTRCSSSRRSTTARSPARSRTRSTGRAGRTGKNSFTRKPSAVIGTSPGKIGTAVGQQHLRSILAFCNSPQMNAIEAYIQFTPGLITDDGEVTDDSIAEFPQQLHVGVPWIHHEGLYGVASKRLTRIPSDDSFVGLP